MGQQIFIAVPLKTGNIMVFADVGVMKIFLVRVGTGRRHAVTSSLQATAKRDAMRYDAGTTHGIISQCR
jgi:hypothetical protein